MQDDAWEVTGFRVRCLCVCGGGGLLRNGRGGIKEYSLLKRELNSLSLSLSSSLRVSVMH